MGKLLKNILFITFILFTTIFSKENDGREIIKAYDKGKPAKMDIEITKVKSDNFINMTIDRYNKKIYKDISKFSSQNKDLQKKIYVTSNIKQFDKSNFRETFPHEIILRNNKRYLEIDYSNLEEPKKIYLWVVDGKKIDKLYTGIMDKEYFDPNNPLTFINLKLEEDEKKHVVEEGKDYFIFKVGEITLKKGVNRNVNISIPQNLNFYLKDNSNNFPVDIYFKDIGNKSTLTTSNNKLVILGKYKSQENIFFPEETTLILKNNKIPYFNLATNTQTKNKNTLKLEIKNHKISTMSYFNPFITGIFIRDQKTASAHLIIDKEKGKLLTSNIHSYSNNLDTSSGSITTRYKLFTQPDEVKVELIGNNSSILATKTFNNHRSFEHIFNNYGKVIFERKSGLLSYTTLKLEVNLNLGNNKKVSKVRFTLKTSFLGGSIKNEIIEFNFINKAPHFTTTKPSTLDFGYLSNSNNTNTFGTSTFDLTMGKEDLIDDYTFTINESEILVRENASESNGEFLDEDILLIKDLKCKPQNKDLITNKNTVTMIISGKILPIINKTEGIYNGETTLLIQYKKIKGGKF